MHLILVSDDLSTMIHRHPPVGADGTLRQRVVLPRAGKYRVVVDAYPQGQPNFQLFRSIDVSGNAYSRKPLPPATHSADAGRIPRHAARQPEAARDPARVPRHHA